MILYITVYILAKEFDLSFFDLLVESSTQKQNVILLYPQVKTARPAQPCETCWTDTRPVWVVPSPSRTSSRPDRTS